MLTSVLREVLFVCLLTAHVSAVDAQDSLSSLAPRIANFKMSLHRIMEGSRIRRKRQQPDTGGYEQMRFGSSTPEDLPYLSSYNLTFWVQVGHDAQNQLLVGTEEGYLILLQVSDSDDKNATTIAVSDKVGIAKKAKAFTYDQEQWFVVLHSSERATFLRLYLRVGRGLEQRQTINLDGDSDMDLVAERGVRYLAVVTFQTQISQSWTYQSSIVLYHWTRTQFDVIAKRGSYGARSVTCWILGGSLYLAVAQETDDDGNFGIGSPIYLYNSKEENRLVLREILSTYGPRKVVNFYVGGSHYAIFIGQRDAMIYWWSNDQFLLWQTIRGTAYASDVSVLYMANEEVSIVIAMQEEVLFLALDASGHYVTLLTMRLSGSSLMSLQFISTGRAYYALALFAASAKPNPSPIWKLTLVPYDLPKASSLDPLRQCLQDSADLLQERQTELALTRTDLSNVWLKNEPQRIFSKVLVKGAIISEVKTDVVKIFIVTHRTKYLDTSTALVNSLVSGARSIIDWVRHTLDGSVSKSTNQVIRGNKHFSSAVKIPSLNMESTNIDVTINRVAVSRLAQFGLLKTGHKVFLGEIMVSNVHAGNISLGSLNGLTTDDLLLLHGEQIVTGNLKFNEVRGNEVTVENINSIAVDNLVTSGSRQEIKDLKALLSLQARDIDVHGQTNREDLGEVRNAMVTVDGEQKIKGSITLAQDVYVNGNILRAGLINGVIDVSELAHHSVTKYTQQDLTGHRVFTAPQFINGDLTLTGLINGVNVSNLLTLSTHQIVNAPMDFTTLLSIERDLIVHLMNGIDLDQQAALKVRLNQYIEGMKTFTRDLMADFIDMTEYVTLDGVDPSLLFQDIVRHTEGVVTQNFTTFHNVLVLGNVSAIGGINGYDVFDLPYTVWRKSIPQMIDVPLNVKRMVFHMDLEANRVNELDLEKDVVRIMFDETIQSVKTFQNMFTVDHFSTVPRVQINGIEISSFTELGGFADDWTVHGMKVLEELQVLGNVDFSRLNDLNAEDFMQPDVPQTVFGGVEFPSHLTTVLGNSKTNAIAFDVFNGLKLLDFYMDAVLRVNPKPKPIRNKTFLNLQGSSMSLQNGSKISGVSLLEMAREVVTLNTPQVVTAAKSFVSPLIFTQPITAVTLNGRDISDYVSNVVLVDMESNITASKQFIGKFLTSDVSLKGHVNGIKIEELASDVFYKSEDNEVTSPFTFLKGIDAGNLLTTAFLDGMDWNDLILLREDENLGPAWFLSNVHAGGNVLIVGLLNGCDLSQIQSSALYSRKEEQVVKGKVNFNDIEIIGHLRIKNLMNKISIEDMKRFISISEEQSVPSDVVVGSDISVESLHLIGQARDFGLISIMEDAVRRSIPQVIAGHKDFRSTVKMNSLTGGDVFVHGKLNGVDLNELYSTAVMKNGHQVIEGEKIFPSLTADVATLEGYLNGLILPRDVVMTSESEEIAHPVFFMSDLYLESNLAAYGNVDGVDLEHLIQNRVTLRGDQIVTSNLTFSKDVVVYDGLAVEGTINDIVLELVCKVNQSVPVEGFKMLTGISVTGSLVAASVNGYDLHQLSHIILRSEKEEFVNEFQIFNGTLLASSLDTSWINNISLQQLVALFSSVTNALRITLDFFQDLNFSLQQQLGLLTAIESISKFAYFVLIQEINFGPTTKILHGYRFENPTSEFSHSMVMWTSHKHCTYNERCCEEDVSYWMMIKKSGYAMVDSSPEFGKIYPIHNPAPVTYSKEFFIWTNSTMSQPRWCGKNRGNTMFASFTEKGDREDLTEIRNSPILSEVKTFRWGHLYAVAAFYYDVQEGEYSSSVVYVFNEMTRKWAEHQILPSFGALSLDVTNHVSQNGEEILLAVGTGMGARPFSHSTVYKWNDYGREFEILQNIPSRYVTSTIWFKRGAVLHLALAGVQQYPGMKEDCLDSVSGGQVDIYAYDESLEWIQSIPVTGVVSLASFSIEGDAFLVAASNQLQTLFIFEWKGYSKFALIQTLFAGDVRHLSTYIINGDTYMTVATASGPSKVLKVVTHGKQMAQHAKYNPQIGFEQRDEVPLDQKYISGC